MEPTKFVVSLEIPRLTLEESVLFPQQCLDLLHVYKALEPNLILSNSPLHWNVCKPRAPYSMDFHAMMVNVDPERYIPSLVHVPEKEVICTVVPMLRSVVCYACEQVLSASVVNIGWNWSPRSWGATEGGGFQSLRTKWHPMIWTWSKDWNSASALAAEQARGNLCSQERDAKSLFGTCCITDLPPQHRSYFSSATSHCLPLLQDMCVRLNSAISSSSTAFISTFEVCTSCAIPCLSSKILVKGDRPWFDLFCTEFFSSVVLPVSRTLDECLLCITECCTTMNCKRVEEILKTIETRTLTKQEIEELESVPELKPDAKANLIARGFSAEIYDSLSELINNRRMYPNTTAPLTQLWRKGFGYSFVIQFDKSKKTGELRILIGAGCGLGGPVECLGPGVFFKRDATRAFTPEQLSLFDNELAQLAIYVAKDIGCDYKNRC